ncbi:hypothetical protein LINPERPRIM_LOCUS14693 [Linum perenne]
MTIFVLLIQKREKKEKLQSTFTRNCSLLNTHTVFNFLGSSLTSHGRLLTR